MRTSERYRQIAEELRELAADSSAIGAEQMHEIAAYFDAAADGAAEIEALSAKWVRSSPGHHLSLVADPSALH